MRHLKKFESYKGPIHSRSKFNQDEMDELYEIFQDFACEFNIKDMTINTSSDIPSQFDEDDEVNQYIIGQARNSYVDLRLFTNVDEIIETLRDNFIPQIKLLGWYIPSYSLNKDGMSIEHKENDNETPYTDVSITFAKMD